MSEQELNEHAWFRESIAAALAGGLDAAGRVRFEAHAATCEACGAELAAMKQMENHMNGLFALPAGGLEDRIIERLRDLRPRRIIIHPSVQRAATAVAAVVVLGGFGLLVTQQPLSMARRSAHRTVASNQPQSGRFDARDSIQEIQDLDGDVTAGKPVKEIRESVNFYAQAPATPGAASAAGEKSAMGRSEEVRFSGGFAVNTPQDAKKAEKGANFYWDANNLQAGDQSSRTRDTVALNISGQNFYSGRSGGGGGGGNAETQFGVNRNQWFSPSSLALNGGSAADGSVGGVSVNGRERAVPGLVAAAPPAPAVEPASEAAPPVSAQKAPEQAVQLGEQVAAANPPQPAEGKPPATEQQVHDARKIIRNGQMEFEVDRFDAAFAQVSKLTQENGGYIGTTDSEKLPNGKVKGTVILRVPPDRLDTLVLQLRGIGDLKSQKLEAQDISKQYTDLESELRAAKAMEERLLQIIKEGKGAIKDLLAAEKELGTWREKVEKITGEMRYFDNLVSLSTLHVTLMERDIQAAAKATETETIDAGVETVDVEKARAEALKAIEEAKGRVIQSDLKRYDAGQFGATIVAEVPPDASGPLLDRIRQIGKVARLDIQRKQTADSSDNTATNAPPRVDKRDTRLNLSLYNLANVAPRQSSNATLAAEDVEKAYQAIITRVNKAGGRIVTSNLARQKPEQTTGTIAFEVPSAESDAVTNEMRALGEVMNLSMTENPDVNNVTTAKRGFSVSLVSSAAVAPRETTTVQIASADVAGARAKILAAAGEGGARILTSQLNENDRSNPSATLEIDVKRAALPAVEKALADAGDAVSRSVTRSSDTESTIDSKVKLQITLTPADKLPPREATALTIELADVEGAMAKVQQSAGDAGGRVTEQNLSKDRSGAATGKIAVEVPLDKAQSVLQSAKDLGAVRAVQATKNQQVPAGALARARIDITFGTSDTIVEPGSGVWATIRNGLSTSVAGLLWSLQLIVIGLCFVLPWGLILWAGWKLIKRRKPAAAA